MNMRVIREMPRERRRLDSWKEIAAFFGREERTVKRWEKEKGLPVHRLPESTGARVFAFTDELTRWMNSPESARSNSTQEKPQPIPLPEPPIAPAERQRRGFRTGTGVAAAIVVLLVIGALALLFRTKGLRHTGSASTAASAGRLGSNASTAKSSKPAHVDPKAQELYLTGRYYWDKRTPDDLNKAVDYFNQAIARDPSYAAAYVGLANCYSLLREFAAMPSEEAFPRALAAARKAIELDDTSAEAHNALALVTFYWNWDAAGAEREFRRAIELDPKYVTAHHWYATFLMALCRFPEALEQIGRAQQLDPASTPIFADKAFILFHQGNRDQAISLLKQLSISQPGFFSTHQYLALIYLANNDYLNYLEEARKAAALSHNEHEMAIVVEAEKGYRAGGGKEMLESILRMQKKYFEQGSLPAFVVADTYARLGNRPETLRYLKLSFQRHEVAFLSIRVSEPLFFLHNDPAFRQLVVNAGLPPLT